MAKNVQLKRLLLVSAIAAISFPFLADMVARNETTFDDAFMFTRYAKHWLAGGGPSWNLSDGPAYGCTSLFYLFVVTLARWLAPASDARVLLLLSASGALFSAAALAWLAYEACPARWFRDPWLFLLPVPWVLRDVLWRFHSGTGMETTFAVGLVAGHAALVIRYMSAATPWRAALCLFSAYLAYLARPETALISLTLAPLLLLNRAPEKRPAAIRYLLTLLAIFLLDAGAKRIWLGSALPLPFFAKRAGFYQGYLSAALWNPLTYLFELGRSARVMIAILVLFPTARSGNRVALWLLPALLLVVYLFSPLQIMGTGARFYLPLVPLLLAAALTALEDLTRPSVARWGAAALVVLALSSDSLAARSARAWTDHVAAPITERLPLSHWTLKRIARLTPSDWWNSILGTTEILRALPPGLVFAASEHGYLGTELPDLTVIDMLGLHDRQIAHHGFSAPYVLGRRPDLIWLPHVDYSAIRAALIDNRSFQSDYLFFPDFLNHGMAVRKDSPHAEAILNALQRYASAHYGEKALESLKATFAR